MNVDRWGNLLNIPLKLNNVTLLLGANIYRPCFYKQVNGKFLINVTKQQLFNLNNGSDGQFG